MGWVTLLQRGVRNPARISPFRALGCIPNAAGQVVRAQVAIPVANRHYLDSKSRILSFKNLSRGGRIDEERILWRWELWGVGCGVSLFVLCSLRKKGNSLAMCKAAIAPTSTEDAPSLLSTSDASKEEKIEAGKWKEGLPCYTREEVRQHTSPSQGGAWVYFKEGVYDISDFVAKHPGGAQRISLALGGSLEPFWAMYQQHNTSEVHELVETFRIGNYKRTAEDDASVTDENDPFAKEPSRHPALRVVSQKPFNAETPLQLLCDNFITPTELFFVRNHLPVPILEEEGYGITIDGLGFQQGPVHISLEGIKEKFKHKEVTTTIQCAGNRRELFNAVKQVKGLRWGKGAIGTTSFRGAPLKDVLSYVGIYPERLALLHAKHIQFEGWDEDALTKNTYGASVPVEKALSEDVLLAWEMNGEPLTRDHGFPLRVIIPGLVGARQVKWLKKIVLSGEESPSFWQQSDYRVFGPGVDWDKVDWRKAPAIQESPVQSAVCDPLPGTVLDCDDEEVTIKGYAWSGGGRAIVRVDVSLDDGKTWEEARLRYGPSSAERRKALREVANAQARAKHHATSTTSKDQLQHLPHPDGEDDDDDDDDDEEEEVDYKKKDVHKAWAWVLWELTVPIPEQWRSQCKDGGSDGKEGAALTGEICCRAVDASYNVQPESVGAIWNLRGCLCNAWDRVKIEVPPRRRPHSEEAKFHSSSDEKT